MSVKICGHEIRWQRPIKIYNLIKVAAFLMVVNLLSVLPAYAADHSYLLGSPQASSGSAVPCLPLHTSGMTTNALNETKATPTRTQRTAGPSSMSPAMALALALGVRNISGPMVHTTRHVAAKPPSLPLEQQAMLLPRDKGCAPALTSYFQQPRMAMEK